MLDARRFEQESSSCQHCSVPRSSTLPSSSSTTTSNISIEDGHSAIDIRMGYRQAANLHVAENVGDWPLQSQRREAEEVMQRDHHHEHHHHHYHHDHGSVTRHFGGERVVPGLVQCRLPIEESALRCLEDKDWSGGKLSLSCLSSSASSFLSSTSCGCPNAIPGLVDTASPQDMSPGWSTPAVEARKVCTGREEWGGDFCGSKRGGSGRWQEQGLAGSRDSLSQSRLAKAVC